MTAFLLTALLAVQATQSGPVRPEPAGQVRPDTVFTLPGGPRFVLLETPGSDAVAIRISIPFEESVSEAGVARVLQLLTLESVRSVASQAGARVEGTRTPWGLSYTVSGALADFDHLAWVVRELLDSPGSDGLALAQARVRSEADRAVDTPIGVLRTALRTRVAPALAALEPRPESVSGLTMGRILDFWERTHAQERLTLVVVGSVAPEAIFVNFQGLGAPSGTVEVAATPQGSAPRPRRPQLIRTWYGEAWVNAVPDDPRAAVAAILMGERLRDRVGRYEVGVELWEYGSATVLVVMGAAYQADARAMRERIQGFRRETAAALTDDAVARAVARVRREVLLAARTPAGLAHLLGRHLDAAGETDAADRFVRELEGVDRTTMVAFFQELAGRRALTAELSP